MWNTASYASCCVLFFLFIYVYFSQTNTLVKLGWTEMFKDVTYSQNDRKLNSFYYD